MTIFPTQAGMDALSKPLGDGSSDYGSDFSPEDEDALIALLSQISHKVEVAPVVKLEDIKDDESPHAAHMPRKLGREPHRNHSYPKTPASQTSEKTTTAFQYAGSGDREQKGTGLRVSTT